MSTPHNSQEVKKIDTQPKCPWDVMKGKAIGSTQTHPETGANYRVGVTPEDNRRFLTLIAA
jgi:hypothetical protein